MSSTPELSQIWSEALLKTFEICMRKLIDFQNTIWTGFENCSDFMLSGFEFIFSVQEMTMFDKILLYILVVYVIIIMSPKKLLL